MVEKEDLEFFKTKQKAEDFFKENGYQTGVEKFKELVQEGFLKQNEGKFALSEMGKSQLIKSSPEQMCAKLRIILKKAKEILEEKDYLEKEVINGDVHQRVAARKLLHKLDEKKEILINEFNEIAKDLGTKKMDSLYSLEIELSSLVVRLGNKKEKSSENSTTIEPIRERIISLNLDSFTEKNLLRGLKCLEEKHYLGSFLISGRIIANFINKIRGETKEEKIELLENQGIIKPRKKDKDRADKKMFIKLLEEHMPNKKYRDFASHQITYFPDVEEAMRELTNAIEIAKRVKDLQGD